MKCTAVTPGTVGTVPTVPLFLAGTANRTTISIEKNNFEMKKGYSLLILKSNKLEGQVLRTSVEMVHMTYRAMVPRILSFLGRLIRTAPFRKVTSI